MVQPSEIIYARVRPDAVECPHNGRGCGHHEECAARCDRVIQETVYGLQGTGFGVGRWPDMGSLSLAAPPDRAAVTLAQLHGRRALNGQPMFEVETIDQRRQREHW